MEAKRRKPENSALKNLASNAGTAVRRYVSDIRLVGRDAVKPYRHFVRWNVAKTAVFAYSYLLGLVLSLPFIGMAVAVVWWALTYPAGPNTQAMLERGNAVVSWPTQIGVLAENFGKIIVLAGLGIAMLTVFSVFVAYGWYLMSKVSEGYLRGGGPKGRDARRTGFGKIRAYFADLGCFDVARLRKYVAVLGRMSIPWLAPIGFWIAVCGTAGYLFVGKEDETSVYLLGTSTLLATLVGLVWLLVQMVRTGFATYALQADPEGDAPAKAYVEESRRITRGNVTRILLLFLPFAFLVGTAEAVLVGIDQSLARSRMYAQILKEYSRSGQGKSEAQFVSEFADGLDGESAEAFGEILKTGRTEGEGIREEFFQRAAPYLDRYQLDPNWKPYSVFFNLLAFLALDALFPMVFLSIFLRIGGKMETPLRKEGGKVDEKPEEDA